MIVVGVIAQLPVVRRGLAAVITDEPSWRVGLSAASVDEFLDGIEAHSCAVVVVETTEAAASIGPLAARGFGVVGWGGVPADDLAAGASHALDANAPAGEIRSAIIEAFAARPGADSFCVSQLTTRQLEVLVLVGGGLANKQIASQLGVSISTIKRHMEQLMERTGRRNRAELAVLAAALGELRPETLSVLNREAGEVRPATGPAQPSITSGV